MADNITLDPGASGSVVATDEISSVHYQRVKPVFGGAGVATEIDSDNPLPIRQTQDGASNLPLVRHLDVTGDGTGSRVGNVDGSGTPVILKITPPASTVYRIFKLIVLLIDTNGFTPTEFANFGAALTTGIALQIYETDGPSEILDLFDGQDVKCNTCWSRLGFTTVLDTWGTSDEALICTFNYDEIGTVIRLDGDEDEELRFTINDDLEGLVECYVSVIGQQENNAT